MLGFVWSGLNVLKRHAYGSDIVDRVTWGRKVFRNQDGQIGFQMLDLCCLM